MTCIEASPLAGACAPLLVTCIPLLAGLPRGHTGSPPRLLGAIPALAVYSPLASRTRGGDHGSIVFEAVAVGNTHPLEEVV